MELKGLSPEETAIFEWQYDYCGDFKKALWQAICRADEGNLDLLWKAFPVEVDGYRSYSQQSGWWKEVQKKCVELGYLKTAD